MKDIRPGSNSATFAYLTNVAGTLYFAANDGTNGDELWRSDGTGAGTQLVKDIFPGASNSYPRFLTNLEGTLYFSAYDVTNGRELWKSNGTEAGTLLVKDIDSTVYGSFPVNLTNLDGTLYFIADVPFFPDNDGVKTKELWKSDGTGVGTAPIRLPGNFPLLKPLSIATVVNRLFVAGTAPEVGFEIFTIDLNAVTPYPGDYNRDGAVTPADRTFWAANYGANSGVGLQADGNTNGVVDAADYTVWRDHYVPPGAVVASASVSRPASTLWTPIAASPTRRDRHAMPQRDELPLLNRRAQQAQLLVSARGGAAGVRATGGGNAGSG